MNWAEIGTQVILGIIGVVLSGVGLVVTYLVNKYIKNDKLKLVMNSLNELVRQCVQEVYQTYVEALKDKNMFDEAAQKKALEMCLEKIMTQMPADVEKWLQENYPNVKEYLITLIESWIATLKITGK